MINADDITIIGGGIIGTTIALDVIKKHPGKKVSLIEKRMCGSGSSFYSAGVHIPYGNNKYIREMSDYSHHYYQPYITGGAPFYALPVVLITHKARLDETLRSFLPLANFTLANGQNPVADIHINRAEQVMLYGQGAHYADVFALTQKWLLALRPLMTICEGLGVEALRPQNNGYQLILSNGSTRRAGQVILAPGPWLAELAWQERISALNIRVKKIVAVHIARRPAPDAALTIFHGEEAFLLPCHSRGHWLFSYTCQQWDVLPDNLAPLQARDVAQARAILNQYAPALAAEIRDGRVFCDAYSPSREPVIVRLDEHLIFAGGANGSGYRLAPAIAANAVHLLTHAAC